jgi:sortase (surface protein transpeptidase)
VSAPIVELGLTANRHVQVPKSTTAAGWYGLGPTPGQLGSAVLLGHVDSLTGPGVFFRLKELVPGDQVRVTLADGVVARFVVQRVVQYTKSSFPDRLVYGLRGSQSLNLVTCGGAFDHATGHYLANIVVFTTFVSATKRPA